MLLPSTMNLLALALAAAVSLQAPSSSAEQGGGSAAEPDPPYLHELLARAHALNLAADTQWLRLGHWRRGLGGVESEADGSAFFLSPRGKTDPAAELDATLAAFFAPPSAEPDRPLGEPQRAEAMHPQCRFPARLSFVASRLGLDPARLPLQRCPRFEAFWTRVQARSVTLIFSSYYLNNPASSFGHTFLRLDKVEGGARDDRHELLDQGVDYAAVTDTSNALLYAVKGLTGLFHGQFTARPYFYKVREYADYESRDLWEYDLALEPSEVAMLVAHLWELGGTWFDYWYLTENCSYHVLGALEAAAPRLQLLSRVGKVVIPADTVKAVAAEPGLVRAVRWRPSIRTQFQARTAGLDAAALDGAARLLCALYRCYDEGDCDLAEINPLVLTTDGRVLALDAKVTLDDNAAFRHPEWAEYAATETEDPRERLARERGLTYIGLDGTVGIIANGAGLAMSTLDVVNQAGGSAANFLDIGGGANADVMAAALEVINTDSKVRSILVNIFGGITRVDDVARGVLAALDRVEIASPIVLRLDGTNAAAGRELLEPHLSDRLIAAPTMLAAAARAVELAV